MIEIIKSDTDIFTDEDAADLDLFTGSINTIVHTNNHINNFKQKVSLIKVSYLSNGCHICNKQIRIFINWQLSVINDKSYYV